MQVEVKTLLNRTQPIPGFFYADVRLVESPGAPEIWVEIHSHTQRRGLCPICGKPAPTYDHLAQRSWRHVDLWRITTYLFYAPRRVDCQEHGVHVESIPWSECPNS